MTDKSGTAIEWLVPIAFVICAAWLVWHIPAFTLDWYPPDSSQADNLRGLHHRNDVTPGMSGPFGGEADWIDYLALVLLPIIAALGIRTVRRAPMEYEAWGPADRISVFMSRSAVVRSIWSIRSEKRLNASFLYSSSGSF